MKRFEVAWGDNQEDFKTQKQAFKFAESLKAQPIRPILIGEYHGDKDDCNDLVNSWEWYK